MRFLLDGPPLILPHHEEKHAARALPYGHKDAGVITEGQGYISHDTGPLSESEFLFSHLQPGHCDIQVMSGMQNIL